MFCRRMWRVYAECALQQQTIVTSRSLAGPRLRPCHPKIHVCNPVFFTLTDAWICIKSLGGSTQMPQERGGRCHREADPVVRAPCWLVQAYALCPSGCLVFVSFALGGHLLGPLLSVCRGPPLPIRPAAGGPVRMLVSSSGLEVVAFQACLGLHCLGVFSVIRTCTLGACQARTLCKFHEGFLPFNPCWELEVHVRKEGSQLLRHRYRVFPEGSQA
eukprot:scaffold306131_cov22-Tisochrysis_lutea.AAC.1